MGTICLSYGLALSEVVLEIGSSGGTLASLKRSAFSSAFRVSRSKSMWLEPKNIYKQIMPCSLNGLVGNQLFRSRRLCVRFQYVLAFFQLIFTNMISLIV